MSVVYSNSMRLHVFFPVGLSKQSRALRSCHLKLPIVRGFTHKPYHTKAVHQPFHNRLRELSRSDPCSKSADTSRKSADFFRYTSGRWLWNEEEQLADRYKAFNVPELQRVAAESVGANMCVGMTKLGEGNYNKVFRLIMDNGLTTIARIPNPNAGPPGYTTASEVATMDLVVKADLSLHSDFDRQHRLVQYFKFLFPRSSLGVQRQTIRLGQNI